MSSPVTIDPNSKPIKQRLLENRIIFLDKEVRDDNANELIGQILLLSAQNRDEDIFFYINSPGGSVTAGSGIYDAMELVPNDIVTVGIGMAASMGQFLLTAGTPGKRFATPLLRVLLHQPSGGFGGTVSDVISQRDLILDMKNTLAGITAKNTGKTVEEVNKDGDRDHWYTAKEAKEYGFVDHILTNMDEIWDLSRNLGKVKK